MRVMVAVVAASLMFTGCMSNPSKKSSSGATPDWVVNEPVRGGHVYGVGSAQVYGDAARALQQAQDAARVTMVQKLKVTISGSFSQDTQEVRQTGQQTQLMKTVRNTITSTIPNAELDNVVVEENFVDQANKVAYSLVHLDRVKAASKLRQRISDLDLKVTDLNQKIATNQDTLKQLQGLMPALKWLEQREQLSEQMQLVDVNNRSVPKDEMLVAVEDRIQNLFDALVVNLVPSNQDGTKMRDGLVEALTDLGLRISKQSPHLTFRYAANLRPVEKGGRFIVFASGKVSIEDANGRTLSSFTREAKGVSAASSEQAEFKAVQGLAEVLGQELAKSFVEKIN
ncbi:MAG: LPP20 family lipoprotein [Gammaproteobacteria bacterium]|nr:LPP20 family lipoprotein [Gammaproteobacteria bacterium]